MWISIDGDKIGKTVEKYLLEGNLETLSFYSRKVKDIVGQIEEILIMNQAIIIVSAGDEIISHSVDEHLDIHGIIKKSISDDITFSCGIGTTCQLSFLALKYAKSIGGNHMVTALMVNENVNFTIRSL